MKLPFLLPLLILQVSPQQIPPDKASVSGYILKMGTGEPLAKTTVILSPFNGGPSQAYTATSSAQGQFSFVNLDPGQYRLSATRSGYIRMEYGARTPNRPGLPITLSPGERLADIGIQLVPAGTISGRIFDRDGEPFANVTIEALKYSYQDGHKTFNVVQSARTNDLGEYRLFGLQPGQYFVSTTLKGGPTGQFMNSSSVAGPSIGGGVGDFGGNSDARQVVDEANEGYIPVYYPGTMDVVSAAPINLPPGIVFSGLDMTVTALRTLRIAGHAINGVTGQPVENVDFNLIQTRGGGVSTQRVRSLSNRDYFEIRGVMPGSYELVATLNYPNNWMSGRLPLEIGTSDLQNIAIIMTPGFSLAGHLSIEGQATGNNQNTTQIRVMLRPDLPLPGASPAAPVQVDGTFTLQEVGRDNYRVTVSGMPQNAYVKAARYGATDILDDGIRLDRPSSGPIDILVGTNPGSATGTVQNDKQEASVNVTVVLIPDAPKRNRLDMYRTTSTDAIGQFHVDGIPPGNYKAFAWEDVDIGAWQDPDFIRGFEDRGKPVRINEGGTSNIELRVIPPEV
jgi:hypothetical protein